MCWLVWTSKDLGGDRPDSRAIWKPCTGETRCYRFPAEMTWRVNLSPPQPDKGSTSAYPSEGHTGSHYKSETLTAPRTESISTLSFQSCTDKAFGGLCALDRG